jgi:hypothetical protein
VAAGDGPRSVTVADLNGDGRPDLVTANFYSDNVSILLGNGAGGFATAAGFPAEAGDGPVSVAVADVNGDGRPDLVTANIFSNNVSVLLGDGAGGFSAAAGSPVAVGGFPISVAVADLNGDGRPDLVTANFGSDNVSVLLGKRNAATHFQLSPATTLPGITISITVKALTAANLRDSLYRGTIRFSSSDGSAILPVALPYAIGGNAPFALTDDGSRTFSVILNTSGTQTITVTDTIVGKIVGSATVKVNRAPVLDPAINPTLVTIAEDATTPASTLVSSLLAGAVTDADAGPARHRHHFGLEFNGLGPRQQRFSWQRWEGRPVRGPTAPPTPPRAVFSQGGF